MRCIERGWAKVHLWVLSEEEVHSQVCLSLEPLLVSSPSQTCTTSARVLPPEPGIVMRSRGVHGASGLAGRITWESPAGVPLVLPDTPLVPGEGRQGGSLSWRRNPMTDVLLAYDSSPWP